MATNKYKFTFLGAFLTSLGLAGPAPEAAADCFPIAGRIFNNALGPGTTLGVAHIRFRGKNFRCGLHGVGKGPDDPGDGVLNFDHTMVCDDDANVGSLVNSQLVWDTTGNPTGPGTSCGIPGLTSFPFQEYSDPVPGSGTGLFAGAARGRITVDGTFYCTLAIDMTFSGYLCN